MTDEKKDKIVNLNQYRLEKEFDDGLFDDELLEELAELSDEEIDDYYDELAFGDAELFEEMSYFEPEVFDRMASLSEFVQKGEANWLGNQPVGWRNPRERAYLSQKMELVMLYKQNGLYELALEQLEQVYAVDQSDSLGCRYDILAIYVIKSDYQAAYDFFFSHDEHTKDSVMVIPMLVAAILAGKDDLAKKLIENLCALVDGFIEFAQLPIFPLSMVMEASNIEQYAPNSMDSLLVGLNNVLPLLLTAQMYFQTYLNTYFTNDNLYLEDLSILSPAQLELLSSYGVKRITDLAEWSEEELFDLPKFGKVTIQKLKEAGVEFRSR